MSSLFSSKKPLAASTAKDIDKVRTAKQKKAKKPKVKKIIYTTNAVEGYHRMVRKFTKSKSIFPTDDAIRKVVYMSVSEISKKWTMPVRDWGLAYAQFIIYFEDRFAA